MRDGWTSVACMDSETSIASMIVARSSGSLWSIEGRAMPNASVARAIRNTPAAAWRRAPMPLGTRLRSRSTLVNLTANARRRSWRHT
jgi:hypothetical protein